MSLKASSYVLELTEAPDGYRLNCTDKCILHVLANCHHPERKLVWPSVEYIAEKACCSKTTAKESLARMEEHLVIERQRPKRQGARQTTTYTFLDIDAPDRLREKMLERGLIEDEEGVGIRPLIEDSSEGKRGREGVGLDPKKGSGRGREGVGLDHRYKEESGIGNRIESGTAPAQKFYYPNSEPPCEIGATHAFDPKHKNCPGCLPGERREFRYAEPDPGFDSSESYRATNEAWPRKDERPGAANWDLYNQTLETICRERNCSVQVAAEWLDARVVERANEVRKWPEEELGKCPGFTSLLRSGRYNEPLEFWRSQGKAKAARVTAGSPPEFDREKFKRENGA